MEREAGTITEIVKGATTSHVRLDTGGAMLTASITNEAVEELSLAVGQKAYGVIKSSDVIIGIDYEQGRFGAGPVGMVSPGREAEVLLF